VSFLSELFNRLRLSSLSVRSLFSLSFSIDTACVMNI
jgi:hypothetical protein